jgi:hypothetical protein
VVGSVPAASAAAAAPVATAAKQASPAGWRISQVLAGVTIGGLWAGGPQDAWLAGDECADPATCGNADAGNGTVVVRHWDGRAWRAVTPPKAYIDSPLDQGVAAVAATSGTNAWVLAARGTDEVAATDALHLTGNGWAAPVRLDAAIETAVAPSPTQLWAFGAPSWSGPPGYFAHFNGRAWTHGSFPFIGTASAARSASDVWVGGGGDGTAPLGIEHWNGRQWHITPLPDLGIPSIDLLWATLSGLADDGPGDVWADISTSADAGGNRPGTVILRWNGKVWSRVAFPYAGSASSPVASDGHGGIWLATASGTGDDTIEWFDHYAGGRWTRVRAPSGDGEQPEVLYLSSMSGTGSLWAAGQVDFANDGEAILTYGRPGGPPSAGRGGAGGSEPTGGAVAGRGRAGGSEPTGGAVAGRGRGGDSEPTGGAGAGESGRGGAGAGRGGRGRAVRAEQAGQSGRVKCQSGRVKSQSGRVKMSETEAAGPRARPTLVQPQCLKAAWPAAALGGSLTAARSSARPSRMSSRSSPAMP